MKEPWKKTCNGKVIITLNDEKTVPTEVEVPVDLNWTNRSEKKCSAPKAIILVGVVLLLGLTVVTLFKIQNLVYSTSYINWRMQELESAVSDSNDDVKLIKYKLSLDEREDEIAAAKVARAEPLIASIGNSKNVEQLNSQDLKLSESQNRKLTTNSLTSESKEPKNTKEAEVQNTNKGVDAKPVPTESTNDKISETTDLNDGRDHPNPADPAEWIKPLVETFDIFGNQPIEDHFIQNVLMKLLMPENNFEVLEFNKMQEASNAAYQEAENQKMMLTPILRNNKEKQIKPLPPAIENMMKSLLPSVSNFKILHFNERPETIQQNNMEEEMVPKMAFQNMKIKQVLPPIEGIVKSLLPPNNMKIFQFNDKVQEQNSEEDMPKITIQSIKLKLLPLPPQEDFSGRRDSPANNMNNIEVIHLNEQPEPSQEVEAPKMPMPNFNPFPFPLQDILMKTILPASKNIEIVPLNEKPEEQHMMHQQPQQQPQDIDMGMHQQEQKFNPLPIPIQDLVMKTLMPPPSQNAESHYNGDSQEQSNQEVEVQKIPIRTIKITPFPLPIPEALMKSMLPMNNYGESINMNESHEEIQQQEQQQQQQQQMLPQPQQPVPQEHQMPPEPQQPVPQEQQMPPEPQQSVPQEQQMPPHPQQEVPRPIVRSTKLNPVGAVWNMAPPPQYSNEPVEN